MDIYQKAVDEQRSVLTTLEKHAGFLRELEGHLNGYPEEHTTAFCYAGHILCITLHVLSVREVVPLLKFLHEKGHKSPMIRDSPQENMRKYNYLSIGGNGLIIGIDVIIRDVPAATCSYKVIGEEVVKTPKYKLTCSDTDPKVLAELSQTIDF